MPLQAQRAKPSATAEQIAQSARERAEADKSRFAEALKTLEGGDAARARHEFHALAVRDPHERKYRVHLHYAWGEEHRAAGDTGNAKAEYQRSLALDSGFAPAQKALREMAGTGSKGLFSKLFGK